MASSAGPPKPVELWVAFPSVAMFLSPEKTSTSASESIRCLPGNSILIKRPMGEAESGGVIVAETPVITKLPPLWPGPPPGNDSCGNVSSEMARVFGSIDVVTR